MRNVEFCPRCSQMQRQSIDVTNFESKLLDFQDKFGNNCRLAKEKFEAARNAAEGGGAEPSLKA